MTENCAALIRQAAYTLESVRLPATPWGLDALQKLVGCSQALRQALREAGDGRGESAPDREAADG